MGLSPARGAIAGVSPAARAPEGVGLGCSTTVSPLAVEQEMSEGIFQWRDFTFRVFHCGLQDEEECVDDKVSNVIEILKLGCDATRCECDQPSQAV